MTTKAWYGVQPYVHTAKGRLAAKPMRTCRSADEAGRLACSLVTKNEAVGAMAYACERPDEDFAEPTIVAHFGITPEGLGEIPF